MQGAYVQLSTNNGPVKHRQEVKLLRLLSASTTPRPIREANGRP